MKKLFFVSLFSLTLGQWASAQEMALESSEHKLLIYDQLTDTFSMEPLDANDLLLRPPPGGGHPGGGHPGGGHPGGGHPGGGHPGGGHPGGGHPGGWRPHPGWHDGWKWNRTWYPGWYRGGMRFPPYIWITVPVGFWQCTAFNANMQAFSEIGPDINQAAYGALYACGGPNYEQMGCYIPQGYCQFRY